MKNTFPERYPSYPQPSDIDGPGASPAAQLAATRKPRKYATGSSAVKVVWKCRLRDLREQLGLPMHAVAKAVGMSTTGLFQIEHGSDPMLTTATKLAKFFDVPTDELWKELP